MLSDEQAAAAKAEYDSLPGTPPDGWNSRKMAADPDANRELFREMYEDWKDDYKWIRYTIDEPFGYLWLEGWKERPVKEAPFSPQYTLADPTRSEP